MSPSPEVGPQTNQQNAEQSWINEELLKDILERETTIVHIDVERATGKGDNYLSIIYRVKVDYRLESSDVHVKNLIIKGLPEAEYMLGMVEELNIFRREISVYRDVLPKVYEFANTRVGNDSFKKFTAYYHTIDRADLLILDDLKPEGFVMASRKDRLDLPHAKIVLNTLARWHALSLAYSENKPDFLSSLEEYMYCQSNRGRLQEFIQPTMRDIIEAVRNWEGFDKIGKKLERLKDIFVDKVIDACKSSDFQNVLLHGDCWVNNILFKYSETGEAIDLRFVDFQIARKNSPAIELQYFLFSSLRSEVLLLHYDNLLEEYYNALKRWATDLGYRSTLFTFEELRQEMKRTAAFGFYSAVIILAVVLADVDDVIDLDKVTVENGEVNLFDKVYENPDFRKAFEPLLLHFDERGVLD